MTLTDDELVARSVGGDAESFNQLILRWERPIYALAYRVIGREDMVHVEQTYNAARAQLERARSDDRLLLAGAWDADKEVARASIAQAQAQIDWHKAENVVMALTGDLLPAYGITVE